LIVCAIVGFPFGALALRARANEAMVAVQDGADEVDMVLDIGAMLSGDFVAVFEAIATVVDAARLSPVRSSSRTACSPTTRRSPPA